MTRGDKKKAFGMVSKLLLFKSSFPKGENNMADNTQDLINEAVQKALQQAQTSKTMNWAGSSASELPEIQGIHVPIKMQTAQGSLRVYLEFEKSWGENAEKLRELIEHLEDLGFPLDIWSRSGSSSSWGNNRSYRSYRR